MAVFAFGQCLMKELKRMYENVYTSKFPCVNSTSGDYQSNIRCFMTS